MNRHTCTFSVPTKHTKSLNEKNISIAFGNWFETFEWDYYCTFTTDYKLSQYSARNAMKRLFDSLEKELGIIKFVWVSEPFDLKEGYHTHALIKTPLLALTAANTIIETKWHKVTKVKRKRGKFRTHVSPYIKGKGGHYYLGKYLHRQNADYDFSF